MTEASLKFGNNRSSRFTDVQAEEFSKLWEVVEHKSNTVTGFSGTLFKAKSGGGAEVDALRAKYGIAVGELTVSLRSTEFADDAAPCAGSGLNTVRLRDFVLNSSHRLSGESHGKNQSDLGVWCAIKRFFKRQLVGAGLPGFDDHWHLGRTRLQQPARS